MRAEGQYDRRWREQFERGERVRLFDPVSITVALVISAFVALESLYTGVGTALSRFAGVAVPGLDPEDQYWWFIFVVAPLMLALAACLWAAVLRPAIQFSETGFTFWDWLGRARRIEYAVVVAVQASFVRSRTGRIAICRVGAEGTSPKWVGMSMDKHRPRFANPLISELASRCDLTESDPEDVQRDIVFLWRAGWRERTPAVPWRVLLP